MNTSIVSNPTTISPSVTSLLNGTSHHNSTSCHTIDSLDPTSTSLLFQAAHICLLIAYLTPGGHYGLLLMHSVLALGHLALTIWLWGLDCYRTLLPTLFGWSVTYLVVNLARAAYQLYSSPVRGRVKKDLSAIYESLFEPIRVSKADFGKLVAKGRLMSLQTGEAYAMEGLTPTDRLALLISGK